MQLIIETSWPTILIVFTYLVRCQILILLTQTVASQLTFYRSVGPPYVGIYLLVLLG